VDRVYKTFIMLAQNVMGMDNNYPRRTLLKAGGAAGIAALIAGCSGNETSTDVAGEDREVEPGERIGTINFASDSEDVGVFRYEWGLIVQDRMEELGFDVEYNTYRGSDYVDTFRIDRDFDVGAFRSGSGSGPDRYISEFYSSDQLVEGGGNFTGWTNDEYDEMVDAQRRAVDDNERQEIVHEMQSMVMEGEDGPVWIPVMVQKREMPLNTDRFSNPTPMPEDSLSAFHNFLSLEPESGVDTLRYGYSNPLPGLNPIDAPPRGMEQVTRLIYDKLMRIEPGTNEPVPWAAEEINDVDDTTIEVSLREGMTWHDGEDVTADDVKFTFEFTNEQTDGVLSDITDPIEDIEVETDLDLTFYLDPPYSPIFTRTFSRILLLPEHIWQDVPEETDAEVATDWQNPEAIGSGPLEVVDWQPEQQLEMQAFEDHFSPPNIENFLRVPFSDSSALVRALEQEEIDMMTVEIGPDDSNRFQDDFDNISIFGEEMHAVHMFIPNHRRPPFDDPAVRRALAYAVPKEEIVDVVMDGRGVPTKNPMGPSLEFWYNDDVYPYDHDMDAARQELEDAGYTWDDDGRIQFPE